MRVRALRIVHRNTYINGRLLRETWQVRDNPSLFFAGQISGVEGYVESAASGLIAGRNAAALTSAQPIVAPPRTTAIGALAFYVSHANPDNYQPTNITFGIMEPPPGDIRDKQKRKLAISERALRDLEEFQRRNAQTPGGHSEKNSLRPGVPALECDA